jgi:hypothetical protein
MMSPQKARSQAKLQEQLQIRALPNRGMTPKHHLYRQAVSPPEVLCSCQAAGLYSLGFDDSEALKPYHI